jgi:cytochrome b
MSSPAKPVWDLPTRLFHWLLVCGFIGAWITYNTGAMQWHAYLGYSVLSLLLFRLGWGIWGSVHSRFSDFVRSPATSLRYLRGTHKAGPGHNPLGAWSVLALLLGMLVQASTGLFNTDEILFDGPLYRLVDQDLSALFGGIHETLYYVLCALVLLHISAIGWYRWRHGERLLRAMITGYKEGTEGARPPAPWWLAVISLALAAGLVWWLVSLRPAPVYF